MRQLIVSLNLSLDGFAADENGSLEWHLPAWEGDLEEYLCRQLASADTILLGRRTYSAMAAYWPGAAVASTCIGEGPVLADMMRHHAKVAVSRSPMEVSWANSAPLHGALVPGIRRLKAARGRNIMVYGSLSLIPALLAAGLVDQFQLWTYPVLLGRGRLPFRGISAPERFQPHDLIRFRTGVVVQTYASSPQVIAALPVATRFPLPRVAQQMP